MDRIKYNSLPVLICILLVPVLLPAQNISAPIHLWPHGAPGVAANGPAEKDNTKPTDARPGNKTVIRLTNVSDPTVTVYSPPKTLNTGAVVIVCPGGGYSILAMDIEGTEICKWLNSLGMTAVLLKYRVPAKQGIPRYQQPLQDAQRAVGWIRYHATTFGIDTGRIGIMGFSAGAHLSATLSNNYTDRNYELVDDADRTSCRPDFVMLIYPAYLTVREEGDKIAPELPVNSHTPPTFLVQTEDDPIRVENSIYYYLALKKEKIPAEIHIYAKGGHGYGTRNTGTGIATWPQRMAEWLQSQQIIIPKANK
jgi:acetyl esterase/lipase